MTPQDIPPLKLIITNPAQDEIRAIVAWLQSPPLGSEEAALRFVQTLERVLPELCADIAQRFATGSNLPRPDEDASIALSRPAYRHLFTTAKSGRRRRGQTAGVWVVVYELPNPSTLRVLFIRHAASQTLSAWLEKAEDDTDMEPSS